MTGGGESSAFDVGEARAMARRLVTHHFGEKPSRVVHQAGGISNFVFLVRHREGEFVVRLSPEASKFDAFVKERWAMSKAREAGCRRRRCSKSATRSSPPLT